MCTVPPNSRPPDELVRKYLRKILDGPLGKAEQQRVLLHVVVEMALSGKEDEIKERNVGTAAFGRDFEPDGRDTRVRHGMKNLRDSLTKYYENQGASDLVGIEIPEGRYAPTFDWRQPREPEAQRSAPPAISQVDPNPFDPWKPSVPPRFVGRVPLFARLQEALRGEWSVSLVGDWRIGKSSVLRLGTSRFRRRPCVPLSC